MSLRLMYDSSGGTYFNLHLNDNYIGLISSGLSYTARFIDELTDDVYSDEVLDVSGYPDKYNRFRLTTMIDPPTGTTQNLELLNEGWYRYEFYLGTDTELTNRLGFGQCYLYDSDEKVENTPTKTTYQEDKTKYVYKK